MRPARWHRGTLLALIGLFGWAALAALEPASAQAQSPSGSAPAILAWAWPEPIAAAIDAVVAWQRQANALLAREVRAIKNGEGLLALAALLAISLGYGVLHTLGPGHGKAIVAAYFLDRRRPLIAGLFAGGWVALTHTISAIAIVLGLALIAGMTSLDTLDRSRLVELVAYGLITAIGLWRLFAALTGREHLHHDHGEHGGDYHHHDGHADDRLTKPDAMLGLLSLAGIVPCSGSMIVMLFSMANGVLWVGIVATLAISLGMAATLAAIGIVTVLLRRRFVDDGKIAWLPRLLTVAAALLVTGFGAMMLIGVLSWAT